MLQRTRAAAVAAAALSLFVAGCGGGGGTVSGTVTLDGNPLKTGVVTFHPVAGGAAAIGAVTKDGSYEVAIGTETAIPQGEYLVTVDGSEPTTSEPGPGPPTPPAPPRRIIPDKYANKDTTDLRATVKAGSNKIPLELKTGR